MSKAIEQRKIEKTCEQIGKAFTKAVWIRRRHIHNAWMFMSIDRRLRILEQEEALRAS